MEQYTDHRGAEVTLWASLEEAEAVTAALAEGGDPTTTDIGPKVAAVASALGAEWSATHHGAGYVLTDGTVQIVARPDRFCGGKRIEFSVSHRGSYDLLHEGEGSRAEASSALTRSPKAIARQIEQKILPDARKWAAMLSERAEAPAQGRQRRWEFAVRVADILPTRTDDEVKTLHVDAGAIRLRHDADGGSVELHGLSPEQILCILEIVAE